MGKKCKGTYLVAGNFCIGEGFKICYVIYFHQDSSVKPYQSGVPTTSELSQRIRNHLLCLGSAPMEPLASYTRLSHAVLFSQSLIDHCTGV